MVSIDRRGTIQTDAGYLESVDADAKAIPVLLLLVRVHIASLQHCGARK